MARVCLLEPLQTEEKNISRRIETLVYPFLAEATNQYFSWKARVYIHGVCPNKRMSCIGKYRRNLMSFAETSLYLSCWAGYSVLEGAVVIVAMVIGSPGSTSTLVFWIHNFLAFAFIDVFHGIYIPLSMTLPSSLPTRNKRKLHPCASGPLEPRRCWTSLDSIAQPTTPCPPPPSSPLSLSIGRTLQVTDLTVWQVCGFVFSFCLFVFIFVVLRGKMDNNKPFSDRSAASRRRGSLSGPENDEKSDEILQDFTFKRGSLSQCSRCKYPRLLQY